MATQVEIKSFIDTIAPIAQRQTEKHGGKLFASVCIAQAAHESGWGTSGKMIRANAVYGIKVGKSAYKFGTAWDGSAYKTGTTEYYDGKNATKIVDWFRAYSSLEASTEDYMDMLCHCQRYKKALNCRTPEESIRAIVDGGYATGPEYAEHIIATIKAHNLTKYDTGVAADQYPVPERTLRIGAKGDDVRWVQDRLNANGFDLKVDGIFGKITESKIEAFQLMKFLKVDGIVGPETRNALKA